MKTLTGKEKEVFKKALKFSRGLYKSNFNELFGRKHRIEIPINHVDFNQSSNYKVVKAYLEEAGYKITDYVGGYAQKNWDKNTYKIGRLVKDNIYVRDKYRDCVYRQNLKMVISRHPYDLACASWNQDWRSCLCFEGGFNEDCLKNSIIANNLLIAYLVGCNRGNVMGRCFVIPYYDYDTGDLWLHPAKYSYGIFSKENIKFLEQWVDKNYNEKYVIPKLGKTKYKYSFHFPNELVYDNDDKKNIIIYNEKIMENRKTIRESINKGTIVTKYKQIVKNCDSANTEILIDELKKYIDYHSLYTDTLKTKMFYYYLTGEDLGINQEDYIEFLLREKLKIKPSETIQKYIIKKDKFTKFKDYIVNVDEKLNWDEGKRELKEWSRRRCIKENGVVYKRLLAKFV
jgi:hypothetical protein